jgi:hypothetical protein
LRLKKIDHRNIFLSESLLTVLFAQDIFTYNKSRTEDTMPSESLYGIRKPKAEASKKDATSASTLAFTTHLSSLISQGSSTSAPSTHARVRPSKLKSDIFSVHNKGAQKRAAADISGDGPIATAQVHKRGADIGPVDEGTLNRSKRKLSEKAKLYNELKRGEYLVDSSDEEDAESSGNRLIAAARRAEGHSLVDFDRKWADEEARKAREGIGSDVERDRESEKEGDDDYLVEYEDEFGRTRQGSRAEAAEALRQRQLADQSNKTNVPAPARVAAPSNVIHGPAIQHEAFNPDRNIAEQMARLAQRRDRSPTPPPETHYNAEGEVRQRGTGFYAFSKDEELRKHEMDELLNARAETLNERGQTAKKKSARQKAKEERMKKIEELRGKRRAEEFLSGLEGLMPTGVAEPGDSASKESSV